MLVALSGLLKKILYPFSWTFNFIKAKITQYRNYRKKKKEEDKIDPFDKMYPLMIMLFFL
tara:strand:- start:742 stop:921 length:180 start_codon:yes stop_codon:yes gene_type:complete